MKELKNGLNMIINVKKVNIKDYPNAVYIGRANKWLDFPESKWHNPFPMKNESQRQEVIARYKDYILKCPALLKCLPELKGKTLACWCSPKDCHGRILLELLKEQENEKI